jgi:hypothetical protein
VIVLYIRFIDLELRIIFISNSLLKFIATIILINNAKIVMLEKFETSLIKKNVFICHCDEVYLIIGSN